MLPMAHGLGAWPIIATASSTRLCHVHLSFRGSFLLLCSRGSSCGGAWLWLRIVDLELTIDLESPIRQALIRRSGRNVILRLWRRCRWRTSPMRGFAVQLSFLTCTVCAMLYEGLCVFYLLCRGCLSNHTFLGFIKPFDGPYYVPRSLSGHGDQQCYVSVLMAGGSLCSRHVRLVLLLPTHAFGCLDDPDASSALELTIRDARSLAAR
jgi:hypothetical protein